MHRTQRHSGNSQAGGITIIVALMLLVLLTVASVAMSRNSLREIVTSGFSRQGAMARNVADSGIEWSIHWIDLENSKVAPAGTSALQLASLKAGLLANDTLAGVAKDINSPDFTAPLDYVPGGTLQADLLLPGAIGLVQGYTLGLTRMGKLPITGMSQGVGAGAFTPATGGPLKQAPDLWAIRSDAQVTQGPATFIHAKEVWISTPVQ
ncbi:MAG: hypothetical protein Q8K67_02600 [Geothrix sp.]|nr:hypothetical protein [Geothrix sp.]